MNEPAAGHRLSPHTADLRIEAWASTREQCLAEAVAALVDSFVDRPQPLPSTAVETTVPVDSDENMLVGVLEEVIYQSEVAGLVPIATEVAATRGGLRMRFQMADLAAATPCGAVPKAVSLHRLRFRADSHGWRCAVTIDV
ncbi:archease [Nocardia sp. NPDC051981]|uniref:archease n=1 Tax=Nocardia sp. NPDC051981 TaxID=3155417 RepID=UPI00341C06BA